MEGMTTEQKEDKHEQIKSILAIPPEERTEEDIEAVKNQISVIYSIYIYILYIIFPPQPHRK